MTKAGLIEMDMDVIHIQGVLLPTPIMQMRMALMPHLLAVSVGEEYEKVYGISAFSVL